MNWRQARKAQESKKKAPGSGVAGERGLHRLLGLRHCAGGGGGGGGGG